MGGVERDILLLLLFVEALDDVFNFGEARGEDDDEEAAEEDEALEVLRELALLFLAMLALSLISLAGSLDTGDISLS